MNDHNKRDDEGLHSTLESVDSHAAESDDLDFEARQQTLVMQSLEDSERQAEEDRAARKDREPGPAFTVHTDAEPEPTSTLDGVKETLSHAMDSAKHAGGQIAEKLASAGSYAKEHIVDATSNLGEKAGALKDSMVEKASDLKDAVSEKASDLKDVVSEKASELSEKAAEVFGDLKDKVASKFHHAPEIKPQKGNGEPEPQA